MVDVIDFEAEFEKLTMLMGRTPTSTDGERAKAFGRAASIAMGQYSPRSSPARARGAASARGRDRASRGCHLHISRLAAHPGGMGQNEKWLGIGTGNASILPHSAFRAIS
jgi:hypothetical protein